MKNSINKVVKYFRTVFKDYDFPEKENFLAWFDEFNSLSETIATIYGRIFEGIDKLKLAKLITAVSEDIRVDCTDRFKQLENYTEAILISKEGQNMLHTSNQIFFPCAVDYYTDYTQIFNKAVRTPTPSPTAITDKASLLVTTVLNNIKFLNEQNLESQYGISEYTSYVIAKATFNSIVMANNEPRLSSFFICRSADKILRFLKGEKIFVFADITAMGSEYSHNAVGVKLKTVDIMLKIDNSVINESLQNELKLFQVTMVSSGFYDYKFNNEVYRLRNAIIRPSSYYGQKDGRNIDYKKIQDANPLFSPYTNWEIQLSKISGYNEFSNLKKFTNPNLLVNPELHIVGKASYFDRNKNNTNGHPSLYDDIKVSEYYKEFIVDQSDENQWC
jgi:hypothetical protein